MVKSKTNSGKKWSEAEKAICEPLKKGKRSKPKKSILTGKYSKNNGKVYFG